MALFGLLKDSKDPDGLTGKEKASLLFAGLSDFGAMRMGEDGDALDNVGKLIQTRQLKAKQDKALAPLLSALAGGYVDSPGPRLSGPGGVADDTPVDVPLVRGFNPNAPAPLGGALNVPVPQINARAPVDPTYRLPQKVAPKQLGDPEVQQALLAAQLGGVKGVGDLVNILDKGRRKVEVANGFAYDPYGTGPGTYFPSLEKGMEPITDDRGAVVGARNLPGAVGAAAEMAGAVTGAQEQQKAGYDLTPVPIGGRTVMLPRAVAAPLLAQTFGADNPGGLPQDFGVQQSPAEASADKIRGDARATAQTSLPSDLSNIDLAINTATDLLNNPALDMRTGMWSMAPAIPGTPGAGFEATKKQVLGQIFLDAYSTLKGGGQITEVEGAKATQARARLEAAQSPGEFRTALKDYIGALQRGRDIMFQKAGQSPAVVRGGGQGGGGGRGRGGGGRWTPEQARAELARRRAAGGQ